MNEQLTSDELRQVLAEWIRPMYPKQRQKIAGLFEAVIARAEAAKAEAARLAARVAELESQLAAQQWRPGSETPNAIDTYLVYRAAPPQNEPWRYDFAVWEDDGWDAEGFTHYRPLPPAPDAQEPTP